MSRAISEVNGISITKNLIGINYTKGILIKPKYIVVHDIQNERFTTMREYRNYIARDSMAKESVHYLVGARAIIKILEDDWRGWHVGDRPSKEITNSNSIAVAMFVRDEKDISRTVQNTVELINSLRAVYDINIKNIKRHYDVTGKNCPSILIEENQWSKFQLLLKGIKHEMKPIKRGKIIEVLSSLNIRKEPRDESEVIGKVISGEYFNIYEEFGDWVKTTIESNDKIQEGYLSKGYIETTSLKENNINDVDESIDKEDIYNSEQEEDNDEIVDDFTEIIVDDIEIQNEGSEGIISNSMVETKNDKPNIIKRIEIEKEGTIVNVDTNLEVRRGPGKENFVIGYLLESQQIRVVQQIGNWYKIIYQSTIGRRVGYIERIYVKINESN